MNVPSFSVLVAGVAWPPETFLQRKLEGLARRGINVLVASQVPRQKFSKSLLQGIRIIRLPHPDDSILSRLLLLAGWQVQMFFQPHGWRKIKYIWSVSSGKPVKKEFSFLLHAFAMIRFSPDIVHFEWPSAADAYDYLREIWQCPITLSLRGRQVNIEPYVPGNEQAAERLHQVLAAADAVHCVSEAIAREAGSFGLDASKVRLIHPAVDSSFFCPALVQKPDDGFFHVISAGSLIWRKGYEYALSAIRMLKDKGCLVKFSIIGDGNERQRVVATIHDLDLQKEVVLLGKCTPEQIRDALRTADVFLLSSLSEGISNAVLEAMACGLPVVTTDCGGMREAVTDGVEGFVVPVRDCDAMASALKILWQNPELRPQMGKAGRQRVLRHFTLEQQTQQWIDLYRGLIRIKEN